MRKAAVAVLLLVLVVCGIAAVWSYTKHMTDKSVTRFNEDTDNLLLGLQQYKEFTGSYPTGGNADILKSLSGQTDKKFVIIVVRKTEMNAKGEMVDPWGTPLLFYFGHNGILIRSAGPNKVFEDSKTFGSDDLVRVN